MRLGCCEETVFTTVFSVNLQSHCCICRNFAVEKVEIESSKCLSSH